MKWSSTSTSCRFNSSSVLRGTSAFLLFIYCNMMLTMMDTTFVQGQNIAVGKSSTEGSTTDLLRPWAGAHLANDGNNDPYFDGNEQRSVFHAAVGPGEWRVDLGGAHKVTKIYVFNRQHTEQTITVAKHRLDHYQMFLYNDQGSEIFAYVASDEFDGKLLDMVEIPDNVGLVNAVVIKNRADSRYLELAEVMIFGDQENVALTGAATSSASPYPASRAIDGKSLAFDQTESEVLEGLFIANEAGDGNPDVWWKVALNAGTNYKISQVIIFNRLDIVFASTTERDYLKGFKLTIEDDNGSVLHTFDDDTDYTAGHTPMSFVIDIPSNIEDARFVKISSPSGKPLHIQEVMVFGENLSSSPVSQVGGDPHIIPFKAPAYSFHGQCDCVMMASKGFASGLGIDIHIRTTRVDKPLLSYSYISGAALKLGLDILEVKDDGSLIINGREEDDNFRVVVDDPSVVVGAAGAGGSSSTTFAGFNLTKSFKGTYKNIVVYKLSLGVDRHVQIRFNHKSGMMFLDVAGAFPDDTVGLLGSPYHPQLLGRDGETDLSGEWNTYGEEWQVKDGEPKLFQDQDRHPQYPVGCVYEDTHQKYKSHLRHRRLMMDNTGAADIMVSKADAEDACARATGAKKQFCIDDVMVTQDIELAADPFYE